MTAPNLGLEPPMYICMYYLDGLIDAEDSITLHSVHYNGSCLPGCTIYLALKPDVSLTYIAIYDSAMLEPIDKYLSEISSSPNTSSPNNAVVGREALKIQG